MLVLLTITFIIEMIMYNYIQWLLGAFFNQATKISLIPIYRELLLIKRLGIKVFYYYTVLLIGVTIIILSPNIITISIIFQLYYFTFGFLLYRIFYETYNKSAFVMLLLAIINPKVLFLSYLQMFLLKIKGEKYETKR